MDNKMESRKNKRITRKSRVIPLESKFETMNWDNWEGCIIQIFGPGK
jgi:hypothetical protein